MVQKSTNMQEVTREAINDRSCCADLWVYSLDLKVIDFNFVPLPVRDLRPLSNQ